MSELPAGLQPAAEVVPRDSASVIVVRPGDHGLQVLLGMRSRKARFMPAQWAFPGGGLEREDRPEEFGAFARCAVRELAEETRLKIAVEQLVAVGERTTPPMFPVRFHTHFFLVELPADAPTPTPATEEIEQLEFVAPAEMLTRWSAGNVVIPPPVVSLLRALADCPAGPDAQRVMALERSNAQEQRAARIEFVPGLWMFPVRTVTMPPATTTNVWVPGSEKFVIIDPGSAESSEQERLLEVLERRMAQGGVPLAVLLTHQHQDHISGAAAACRALDVPVRAHAQVLESPLLDGVRKGAPLEDGDTIDLGGLQLTVWHTPGHAPGHLAFEGVDRGWMIVGDLISGISTILIEPHSGHMGDYLASLERMQARGCRMLLPGHGPPIPGKAFANLIRHRRQRETRVLEQLQHGRADIERIARASYPDAPAVPQALIELQTLAHLIELERRGAVRSFNSRRSWERV